MKPLLMPHVWINEGGSMFKKIVLSALVIAPTIYADWIEDLAGLIKSSEFDQLKAENIVQTYVFQDEKEVERLEKKTEANDEDGLWATIRGGTYQLQWAAAKASLRYHKKVLVFIKELPKNERDRNNLIASLGSLNKLEEELLELKERYQKASKVAESLKIAALIAAKEVDIQARKAYIKSPFVI